MVRHVGEQLRHALGELEARPVAGPLAHAPLNWLVIHVLPWPHGAQGPPEFLAREPGPWEAEIEDLHVLIRRFCERGERAPWPVSPVFGRIGGRSWGVLAYRHLDHHLTQFQV